MTADDLPPKAAHATHQEKAMGYLSAAIVALGYAMQWMDEEDKAYVATTLLKDKVAALRLDVENDLP